MLYTLRVLLLVNFGYLGGKKVLCFLCYRTVNVNVEMKVIEELAGSAYTFVFLHDPGF